MAGKLATLSDKYAKEELRMIYESKDYRKARIKRDTDALHANIPDSMGRAERHAIQEYTDNSAQLNLVLHNKGEDHLRNSGGDYLNGMHNAIHKLATPAGRHVTLYSGVRRDYGSLARQSSDGVLHVNSHISASHDPTVAEKFTKDGSADKHIMRISVSPADKVLHVGKLGTMPDEHETVIPSGTKLQYSHTTSHARGVFRHPNGEKTPRTYHIHHFKIYSQQ